MLTNESMLRMTRKYRDDIKLKGLDQITLENKFD